MLAATLGASLLGNMLIGKVISKSGEGRIGAGQDFYFCLILELTLKQKNIMKMIINLT